MKKTPRPLVLVLDFGSQYTQLIARRVREAGVYCEVRPYDVSRAELAKLAPRALILSGSPQSAHAPDAYHFDPALLDPKLPVLGICYGMQLLALETGGALHHHLPLDLPGSAPHQLADSAARHAIAVEEGTRLAAILGRSPEPVNSSHHQGVAEPGPGVVVSARAEDGVVEAIERRAAPFCVGVQWHPERLASEGSRRLFETFVGACRKGA